ncbi:MAG: hypothetical protein U9N85_00410, partial [Bacteroidota bacterium]|nr:hypothetical protein [Bacteroidota bacterium]
MSKKYLYGASVQGIQSFIFETNKLKEIVGASQLIDNINDKEFINFFNGRTKKSYNSNNVIINAAGNIKYIFDSKEDCEKIVREFPKHISNYAPGITISQAVQVMSDDLETDIYELERKLKTQRNKAQMPVDIGFMGLERARKTGKVAIDTNKDGFIDSGTLAKTELPKNDTLSLFKKFTKENITEKNVPFDIEKITGKAENSWLAVIHADGNGLGSVLQNMAKGIKASKEFENGNAQQRNNLQKEVFNKFSKQLKAATEKAAQIAFSEIVKIDKNNIYPFRPVVLGGDDLTVIIRADLAYDFTKIFLRAFERETETHFKELNEYRLSKLTACAGIAYIKDKYPFHYGVHLAESLVKEAKKFSKEEVRKNAKELAPSSIAFYKVQSSFTDDLKDMKARTHYADASKVSFDYGPYLLEKKGDFANVGELDKLLDELKGFATKDSKGISKLR